MKDDPTKKLDRLMNKFEELEKAVNLINKSSYVWDGEKNKFVSGNYDLYSESLLRPTSPFESGDTANMSEGEKDIVAQVNAKVNDVLK